MIPDHSIPSSWRCIRVYTPQADDTNQTAELPIHNACFSPLCDNAAQILQLLHIGGFQAGKPTACAQTGESLAPTSGVTLSAIDKLEYLLYLREAWDRCYPTRPRECNLIEEDWCRSGFSFADVQSMYLQVLDLCLMDNGKGNHTARHLLSSLFNPLAFLWNRDLVNALLLQLLLARKPNLSKEALEQLKTELAQHVDEIINKF